MEHFNIDGKKRTSFNNVEHINSDGKKGHLLIKIPSLLCVFKLAFKCCFHAIAYSKSVHRTLLLFS